MMKHLFEDGAFDKFIDLAEKDPPPIDLLIELAPDEKANPT